MATATSSSIMVGAQHQPHSGFWRTYVFSVDHKVIAKQYLGLSLTMALIGGTSAYLIRWQLAWPETYVPGWGSVEPQTYNAIITMHGTVMVFFVAMPFLLGAFGNYLIPLMIGADDMAFPRLNMMSFWTLIGALVGADRVDVRARWTGGRGLDELRAAVGPRHLHRGLLGTESVDVSPWRWSSPPS